MEDIFSILNGIPSPYSDLVAVAIIFIIIAVISFIIAALSGRGAPEEVGEVATPLDEPEYDINVLKLQAVRH